MLISPALAHGAGGTGSSGDSTALLIILAVVIVLAFAYLTRKKWHSHMQRG